MNPTKRRLATVLLGMSLIVGSLAQVPAANADIILQIPFVDLKVERADYYYQPIQLLMLPKGNYMKFVVKNAGNVAAGPFTVAVSNVYGGATLQTFAISGLPAGGSRTLYHDLPDCNGYGKVNALRSILVDSTNSVVELSEKNNTWSPFLCFDPPK